MKSGCQTPSAWDSHWQSHVKRKLSRRTGSPDRNSTEKAATANREQTKSSILQIKTANLAKGKAVFKLQLMYPGLHIIQEAFRNHMHVIEQHGHRSQKAESCLKRYHSSKHLVGQILTQVESTSQLKNTLHKKTGGQRLQLKSLYLG